MTNFQNYKSRTFVHSRNTIDKFCSLLFEIWTLPASPAGGFVFCDLKFGILIPENSVEVENTAMNLLSFNNKGIQ